MQIDRGVAGQPPVMLGLMSAQVVEDHMQLRFGMLGYYPIHEVQELAVATTTVVAHRYRPVWTSKAANRVVVPWRLYSWLCPRTACPLGRRSHP